VTTCKYRTISPFDATLNPSIDLYTSHFLLTILDSHSTSTPRFPSIPCPKMRGKKSGTTGCTSRLPGMPGLEPSSRRGWLRFCRMRLNSEMGETRLPREMNGGVDQVLRFHHGRTKNVENGVKGCEMDERESDNRRSLRASVSFIFQDSVYFIQTCNSIRDNLSYPADAQCLRNATKFDIEKHRKLCIRTRTSFLYHWSINPPKTHTPISTPPLSTLNHHQTNHTGTSSPRKPRLPASYQKFIASANTRIAIKNVGPYLS
jgi:hypothetical protein